MKFFTGSWTFTFENPSQYPAERPHRMQQIRERSAAGVIHVETFAAPIQSRVMNFEAMSRVDYDGLLDFYLNRVNGMSEEFYFEDERGDQFLVRFMDPDLNFREVSYQRFNGRLNLEVVG